MSLVVGALQERRVDRDHGLHALAGEPGRERHRVLLGDADVEIALGKLLREADEAGAFAHRRRDADETRIARRHVGQPIAEDLRVRRLRCRLRHDSDRRIEFRHAVVQDRIVLGAGIAVALARDDVQQLRSLELADVGERARQRIDVMAVDRPDVVESEFLEQRAREHHALQVFLGALRERLDRRQLGEHLLAAAAHRVVQPRREHAREIAVEGTDRLGDRHPVVVEDDEEVRARRAGVVERLERHAGAHRAVADHRRDVPLLALALRGDRHAERRRDRRRRMRGAERVVLALAAAGESRRPARHPQPAHLGAAAGEDLVRIGLVPDVPHDAVVRRVERVVQRDREFDGAEIRRQMTAGLRNRGDDERAELARELRQRTAVELAQRGGRIDLVEQRIHDRH